MSRLIDKFLIDAARISSGCHSGFTDAAGVVHYPGFETGKKANRGISSGMLAGLNLTELARRHSLKGATLIDDWVHFAQEVRADGFGKDVKSPLSSEMSAKI